MSSPFLEEALLLGLRLGRGALRHHGQATWLADDFREHEQQWLPMVGTLEADLAAGTAGVGSFLAHLAAISGEPTIRTTAVEALRHSVGRGEDLIGRGRLGWYDGAFGVAAASMAAGRALSHPELEERGRKLAELAIQAAREWKHDPTDTGIFGGREGIVAGLLAVAPTSAGGGALDAASEHAARLAHKAASGPGGQGIAALLSQNQRIGLARGFSGFGIVMAAWFAATAAPGAREATQLAFSAERASFEPGAGWLGTAAHSWIEPSVDLAQSWCTGAAGIGIARLCAYASSGDLIHLAEAGAAIEFVRADLGRFASADASLCHGVAGQIELLQVAATLLDEPAHTAAARRAGLTLVDRAKATGGYASGCGPNAHNPSLLLGLAGTGLTLLRLHDPKAAPSPALPPFLAAHGAVSNRPR